MVVHFIMLTGICAHHALGVHYIQHAPSSVCPSVCYQLVKKSLIQKLPGVLDKFKH